MLPLDWTEIAVVLAAVFLIVLINWYFLFGGMDGRSSGDRPGDLSGGGTSVRGEAGKGGMQ